MCVYTVQQLEMAKKDSLDRGKRAGRDRLRSIPKQWFKTFFVFLSIYFFSCIQCLCTCSVCIQFKIPDNLVIFHFPYQSSIFYYVAIIVMVVVCEIPSLLDISAVVFILDFSRTTGSRVAAAKYFVLCLHLVTAALVY